MTFYLSAPKAFPEIITRTAALSSAHFAEAVGVHVVRRAEAAQARDRGGDGIEARGELPEGELIGTGAEELAREQRPERQRQLLGPGELGLDEFGRELAEPGAVGGGLDRLV